MSALLVLLSTNVLADVNCPASETDDIDAVISDHTFFLNDNGTPANSCLASNTITVGGVPSKWVIIQESAEVYLIAPGGVDLGSNLLVEQKGVLHVALSVMPPIHMVQLNDTGITTCSLEYANGLPCPVLEFGYPGQDAEYGRDVTYPNYSDGHAGFSFTKLDTKGNSVSPDATNWSCVKDNVTGLTWEVKTDDGDLHDKDDLYNWYNTDSATNGGDPGYADDDGDICYGYDSGDPTTFCNTEAYVARVNGVGWCGYRDWRMPTKEELRTLLDYSILAYLGPSIDTDYFPNDEGANVLSSSPNAANSDLAWVLSFRSGYDSLYYKYDRSYVRLVRDGQ